MKRRGWLWSRRAATANVTSPISSNTARNPKTSRKLPLRCHCPADSSAGRIRLNCTSRWWIDSHRSLSLASVFLILNCRLLFKELFTKLAQRDLLRCSFAQVASSSALLPFPFRVHQLLLPPPLLLFLFFSDLLFIQFHSDGNHCLFPLSGLSHLHIYLQTKKNRVEMIVVEWMLCLDLKWRRESR